jgi:MFS superfamily sulfate permease-like transporter
MRPKKNSIALFFRALPKNIFSGFVVSLIALPLALGLAMASDAPPISGIITAIVGGVLVSLLGGSFITISGPGNGLVGVLLVAVTSLGLEGTYAAVICSGGLLLILGFLRMGKLSDFFPSSAIQGMLAAIGLIILGKQFHVMLGNKISRDNSIDYLLEIPASIFSVFRHENMAFVYAALAGVLSLLIMAYYPKIRNKYLQLIPAPMWIVLLSIAFSYFMEYVLQVPNPIHPEYMISGIPKPAEIVSQLPTPDFGFISTFPFWMSVLALTLIASIESLLSIKAVDKLDPERRRSNVNKDLKALGLATVGSGFLGGINVVTVIARSSVNVNNGATNRSSNFFHAIFLTVFIVLFSTQLTRIPLPALMAILVFTGYKLASPSNIRKIFNIGKEQLLIFFTTLLVTLFVDLIVGIIAGVLVTLIIHLFVAKSISLFLKNIQKPNVLMYKEMDSGSYYVSVKHFSSFLNFYKLKQKLDIIPEESDVVLDFSLCEFVDHTVMESLHSYQNVFAKRGGNFEVIGLDLHDTESEHPFALRRLIPGFQFIQKNLTKRQTTLRDVAEDYQLNYAFDSVDDVRFIEDFLFFRTKQIQRVYNQLFNDIASFRIFDLTFSEGAFIAREVVRTTMLHIELERDLPIFTLDREGFLEKVYAFAGFKDIPIDNHTDFSRRFYLLGEDETSIKEFFTDDLVHFFESNPYFHIESNGHSLLLFGKERLAGIKEIKALLDFGKRLKEVIDA